MVNFGQIICGLIATDSIVAQEAVKLIRVQYEELKPIITIEVSSFILYRYTHFKQIYCNTFFIYNCIFYHF